MSRKNSKARREARAKLGDEVVKHMAAVPGGAPYIPDGSTTYGFYDAVNYSTNRAQRPYFATDSTFTLTQLSQLRAMALARWGYINVHFIKAAVDLMARLTVGTGFSPRSHCSVDPKRAAAWDEYYLEKTKQIGFMKGESMDELLIHDCRSVDVDGDMGYVMTEDEQREARLQVIESHRIKNGDITDPRCRHGVWTDRYGRRAAFQVLLPGDTGDTTRINAQNFIYLAEHNRPDELRSMTNLIHALAPLQDLYEIIGFEMQSVKKNSELGLTIETDTPDRPPMGPQFDQILREAMAGTANGTDKQNASPAGQPGSPQQRVRYEQVYGSGGKIVVLRTGEKLKAHTHNRPAAGMDQWAEFIIRGIAAGYGCPFEVLWNPESIGGANTRLITALLRARLEQRRAAMIFPKLRRVRFWILSRGIKRGEIKFHPDIFHCDWNPNFLDITVDSGRESRERRANVLAGLDTFTGYFAENGANYERQVLVRQNEIDLQCAAAEVLCKKYPGLPFEAALARIALLTPNANEMRGEAEIDAASKPGSTKKSNP